jgi:flagellar hook assembly protein FlgD
MQNLIRVRLNLVTAEGRLVRQLWEGDVVRGMHRLDWDGTDSRGKKVASGVYYLRIETGVGDATQKLIIVN